MVLHQPLDVEYWFIQVFSGNLTIFILLASMFITFLAAKFKIETSAYIVFIILFAAIMMATGESALLVLAILIGAPVLFWIIRRVVE